jgi:transcriptional regulator with PAS, ATPase and Fis domain
MVRLLLSWIGNRDREATREVAYELGPIAQAATKREFDEIHLLSDFPEAEAEAYARWLRSKTTISVFIHLAPLSGPTRHREIYVAATKLCDELTAARPQQVALTFHLSPGTPAMHAVWLLIAKGRYPAELLESSRDHGVESVDVPFDIASELIPMLDRRLTELSEGNPPEAVAFGDIYYRSREMTRVVQQAQRVATKMVTVVIEGESGTGKELFARAIHHASGRRGRFVAVNCGAIPRELVEAELFGHEAGAFTGASRKRAGVFEAASGGTLFLDELGELPREMQVKLLRVLQEGEVTRVGGTDPVKLDVRVVAATNRSLQQEVAAGNFREDLYYRLAVAILQLPPLRERRGDLGVLVDNLLARVNQENSVDPRFKQKKLSPGARNLLLQHPWPGNVRELVNVLRRVTLWSDEDVISTDDVRMSLGSPIGTARSDILNRPLGDGLNIRKLIDEVARHYLVRAMEEADGNKTRAAGLVGLSSYQTLSNWLRTYKVKR